VLPSNAIPLASFPFALPSILKVDSAAQRRDKFGFPARRPTLAQITPQVSFAF